MNRTKIEYLTHTLNLIVGCSGVGCAVKEKCWARAMAKRQLHKCKICYRFKPHYHRERLLQPLKRKKPSRIGLNFMGETFDKRILESCPYVYDEMFKIVEEASWHTFVILTKQPQNIPSMIFPRNLWLGVSVNRKEDLWRILELTKHPAAVHAISFEPLYENLGVLNLDDIEWVIIGAQTRPEVLPEFHWITSIVSQAINRNIPIFIKDNVTLARWCNDLKRLPNNIVAMKPNGPHIQW